MGGVINKRQRNINNHGAVISKIGMSAYHGGARGVINMAKLESASASINGISAIMARNGGVISEGAYQCNKWQRIAKISSLIGIQQ